MKKEKFIFNPLTLTYEKDQKSLKSKMVRFFGLGSTAVFSGLIFFMIAQTYFPSPKERALMRELEQMKFQYNLVDEQLDRMESMLNDLQYKDANVHRLVFGIEPIDSSAWNAGVGGHDITENVTPYKNTYKTLKNTLSKASNLQTKLSIQRASLDSLLVLANNRENYFNAIPSIKPVQAGHTDNKIPYLSGYGMRIHPVYKIPRMHTGIDFGAPTGTPVRATGDGKVVTVTRDGSGYGLHIVIDHGYGYRTLYAHLKNFEVKEGDFVKKGQFIGTVGNSGTSVAPHLHYEVHYNGKPVNPIKYCLDGLTPQEYSQLVELAAQENKSFD